MLGIAPPLSQGRPSSYHFPPGQPLLLSHTVTYGALGGPMILLCDLSQLTDPSGSSWLSFSGLPPPSAGYHPFLISLQGILFCSRSLSQLL